MVPLHAHDRGSEGGDVSERGTTGMDVSTASPPSCSLRCRSGGSITECSITRALDIHSRVQEPESRGSENFYARGVPNEDHSMKSRLFAPALGPLSLVGHLAFPPNASEVSASSRVLSSHVDSVQVL